MDQLRRSWLPRLFFFRLRWDFFLYRGKEAFLFGIAESRERCDTERQVTEIVRHGNHNSNMFSMGEIILFRKDGIKIAYCKTYAKIKHNALKEV